MRNIKIIIMLFVGLFLVGTVFAVPGDVDGDSCINLGEVSSFVVQWLGGSVSLFDVNSAVNVWLGGCESSGSTVFACTQYGCVSPYNIIPSPQKIVNLNPNVSVVLDNSWTIVTDTSNLYDNFTAYYLRDKFRALSSNSVSPGVVAISSNIPTNSIVIGNPNTNSVVAQLAVSKGINLNAELTKGYNQGYILYVSPGQILVLSNSTDGTFYGVISLMWMLNNYNSKFYLPNIKMTDWPDMEIRGFYGDGTYISSKNTWIDILAKYKMNLWIQGISGSLLTDTSSQTTINNALALKKYNEQRHLRTVSLIMPIYVRSHNANLYEGVFAKNVNLKFDSTNYAMLDETEYSLANGGFETDSDSNNVPDQWAITTNAYSNWVRDCTVRYSGSCSMKFTAPNALSGDSAYLKTSSTSISIPVNKTYVLSAWIKLNMLAADDKKPQITVVVKNSTGADQSYPSISSAIINDNQWHQYYVSFSSYSNQDNFYIYSRALRTGAVEMWVDDIKVTDVTNKLSNIITTGSTGLEVWNRARTIKYNKGTDYTTETSGSYNYKNPLIGYITKIKRVSTGSIPASSQISVSYDYVVDFTTSRPEFPSLADPEVLQMFETKFAAPTMTKLNTEYVYIGLDEIWGMNRDSRSQKLGLENYQLLANFVNNVTKVLKKYNPNVKVLMWDDMINPYHNGRLDNFQPRFGGPPGATKYAMDLISRDVILLSWWYDTEADAEDNRMMTVAPREYKKAGFKTWGVPWDKPANIYGWSYIAHKENLNGIMSAEFDHVDYNAIFDQVVLAANYSWKTVKELSASCNTNNYEFCDGRDNDCNNIYYDKYITHLPLTWSTNVDESFNLNTDKYNCGACGNICYYPRAYSSCVNGQCRFDGCYKNYQNANNNLVDGCEKYVP